MTDEEIVKYLDDRGYEVPGNEFVRDVLNYSPQIRNTDYDFENRIMTVYTEQNKFTFKWKVNQL